MVLYRLCLGVDSNADYGPDILDIYGDDIPTSGGKDGCCIGGETETYSITLDRYDYFLFERGGNMLIDVIFEEE